VLPRFYAPEAAAGELRLPAEEARHLTRVLRLGPGDEIVVFDGRGHEFRARVATVGRGAATVRVIEALATVPEPRVRVTLAQAVLKGDRMDAVVRDATMLGAGVIQPLISEHCAVTRPVAPAARDRWRRVAVSSCKQCRRAVVPDVPPPADVLRYVDEVEDEARIILVEPAAATASADARDAARSASRALTLLVGPEGGWSDAERAAALAAGFRPLTLGRRTLRADAAPLAALSILQFLLGDL
jgi:16S rRNA (uracil1498-N3)-methyltransferase